MYIIQRDVFYPTRYRKKTWITAYAHFTTYGKAATLTATAIKGSIMYGLKNGAINNAYPKGKVTA